MWAVNIKERYWFEAAKSALEKHGFNIIIQKQSIITTNSKLRAPHVINSEREFIEYASLYGADIDPRATIDAERDRETPPTNRYWQQRQKTASESSPAGADPHASSTDGDDREQLLATIQRLRAAGKTVIEQRNSWEQRALTAEARALALTKALAEMQRSDGSDRKFSELRRFLARQFHPDHSKHDGIEKIIRAEIFKNVWPEVERISKI